MRLTNQVRGAAVAAMAVMALIAWTLPATADGRASATETGGAVDAWSPGVVAERPTTVVTVPMTFVGFDRAVARSNGYEIRTGADGLEYAVRRGAAPDAPPLATGLSAVGEAVTLGTVFGNCGSSSVFIDPTTRGRYRVDTAWSVNIRAVWYNWRVDVTGPAPANGVHTWGGPLLGRSSWTGSARGAVNRSGTYRAVASGSATDAFGRTCTSGRPTDSSFIR